MSTHLTPGTASGSEAWITSAILEAINELKSSLSPTSNELILHFAAIMLLKFLAVFGSLITLEEDLAYPIDPNALMPPIQGEDCVRELRALWHPTSRHWQQAFLDLHYGLEQVCDIINNFKISNRSIPPFFQIRFAYFSVADSCGTDQGAEMSAAEVVEGAKYSEDDPLSEDACCNTFKSDGVADMGSSNLFAEINTKGRGDLVSDEIPYDAQTLLLARL